MKQSDFITALQRHYDAEYKKVLGLDAIEDVALREYLKKFDLSVWSHKNRLIGNIQILKHTYISNKTDMLVTCFKSTLDGTSSIYAYLYSRCTRAGDLEHLYVCTGPTYRSQDGEYRSRFIRFDQFKQLFLRYAGEFADVEAMVAGKLDSGKLTFHTDFYYPIGCKYPERKIEDEINTTRLPIKLFILCWIVDFYRIHYKVAENHMNPAYQYIIYQQEDIPVFEKLRKNHGPIWFYSVMDRIISYKSSVYDPDYGLLGLCCGQKIVPLTSIEAVKTDDINFNVWREIYIANLVSNLVLNLISPSFPFINNWFYIQNAHAGLFDNLSMHEKYIHSDIASDVSNRLKEIDKYNYIDRDRDAGPISGKFYRLSQGIQKSIIYADSDIKLSDLSVCITSEYVGRTLRDIPSIIALNERLLGLEMTFSNPDVFAKHMFEFVYAFYCMNSKLGVIHGDLHMNNAALGRLYYMRGSAGNQFVVNPHIAYVLEDHTFVFPHIGFFSMIIDFSRAVIGDYKRLEHEFSPLFAELYFKEQRVRMLANLYHYFPNLVKKYRDRIDSLLINNFPLMFKIITAVDTFVIMTNITSMFSIDDAFTRGEIKLMPKANKLLNKLASHAEELFLGHMQSALEGRITSPDDIEWPNLEIMNKNFAEYILTPEKMQDPDINIVDVFNCINDVTYDIDDYDTWGPLVSIEKEIELRKEYNQPVLKGLKDWLAFKKSDESEVIEELTKKYEQREKDVLNFESWMLM